MCQANALPTVLSLQPLLQVSELTDAPSGRGKTTCKRGFAECCVACVRLLTSSIDTHCLGAVSGCWGWVGGSCLTD